MRHSQSGQTRHALLAFGVWSVLALGAASAHVAFAQAPKASADTSRYRMEVQACKRGQTAEDTMTCLREARNAEAERKQGDLHKGGQDYAANALARCQPLSGEDRAACEARVMGYGETSGSVAGGGILRQVETVVMPPDQQEVTIVPKTDSPVVLVPTAPDATRASGAGASQ